MFPNLFILIRKIPTEYSKEYPVIVIFCLFIQTYTLHHTIVKKAITSYFVR